MPRERRAHSGRSDRVAQYGRAHGTWVLGRRPQSSPAARTHACTRPEGGPPHQQESGPPQPATVGSDTSIGRAGNLVMRALAPNAWPVLSWGAPVVTCPAPPPCMLGRRRHGPRALSVRGGRSGCNPRGALLHLPLMHFLSAPHHQAHAHQQMAQGCLEDVGVQDRGLDGGRPTAAATHRSLRPHGQQVSAQEDGLKGRTVPPRPPSFVPFLGPQCACDTGRPDCESCARARGQRGPGHLPPVHGRARREGVGGAGRPGESEASLLPSLCA